MLSTKAISLREAGGRMTPTKQDNRLPTTTATGEVMVVEIETEATAERASGANKKDTGLSNARTRTQGHPEKQWSVTSATKRGTCLVSAQIIRVTVMAATAERASSVNKKGIWLVTARTSKATTGVSNVSAEMTEVRTGEKRAGSTTTKPNLRTLGGRTESRTRLRGKITLAGGTLKRTTAVGGEGLFAINLLINYKTIWLRDSQKTSWRN